MVHVNALHPPNQYVTFFQGEMGIIANDMKLKVKYISLFSKS